jgi:hypothetical protein
MKQIPLSAVPSQTLNITLGGQNCQIAVYQKQPIVDAYGVAAGLFFDIAVNNVPIANAVKCLDRAQLLLDRTYLGVVGDFMFLDTSGTGPPDFTGSPPYYTGLGTRFLLLYLEAADLASVGA